MNQVRAGTKERPLRVAVVGAGPSGFYVVQGLLKAAGVEVTVDLFDRLMAPYGLVRYGVAPDHQNIKAVTKVYDRLLADPRVRLFGGVEIGKDLALADLTRHYDAVAFCTGAQTDRALGVPGEDLAGSHPATTFVAWYNGHPDCRHLQFDLDVERAIVVGVGNVALDVARILCRTPDELARTDIAEHALEALSRSKVREVVVLGRRGPAQAAFTNSELEELGKMEGAVARTRADEVQLDALSRADLEANPDRLLESRVAQLAAYAGDPATPPPLDRPRTLWLRFLVSPTSLEGDASGRVRSVEIVRNVLVRSSDGSLRPRPTEERERIEAGLVFRAVGYKGVPIEGLPFRADWGTIPHEGGRVLESPDGPVRPGAYVAGWIKRGPSGVIGTNRPCGQETAQAILADLAAGALPLASQPEAEAVAHLLAQRGVEPVDFAAWKRLDAIELERGQTTGRPRVKLVSPEAMREALARP